MKPSDIQEWIEWAKAQWVVIKNAPIPIAALMLVSALAGGALVSFIDGGELREKNARIQRLEADAASDLRRIVELEKRQQPQSRVAIQRDPDGLYQLGQKVGIARDARIVRPEGRIYFSAIVDAANFNDSNDFEYRNYIIKIKSVGTRQQTATAGISNRVLVRVECEIVKILE